MVKWRGCLLTWWHAHLQVTLVYVQYDCILLKSFVCCCLISLHKARRGLSNSKSIYCAHELIQFPTLLCYTLVWRLPLVLLFATSVNWREILPLVSPCNFSKQQKSFLCPGVWMHPLQLLSRIMQNLQACITYLHLSRKNKNSRVIEGGGSGIGGQSGRALALSC